MLEAQTLKAGKFQTSTARDAAMVPYPGFVKAYMHNGYLTSLKEVVHFYSTTRVMYTPFTCCLGIVRKEPKRR